MSPSGFWGGSSDCAGALKRESSDSSPQSLLTQTFPSLPMLGSRLLSQPCRPRVRSCSSSSSLTACSGQCLGLLVRVASLPPLHHSHLTKFRRDEVTIPQLDSLRSHRRRTEDCRPRSALSHLAHDPLLHSAPTLPTLRNRICSSHCAQQEAEKQRQEVPEESRER